MIGPLCLVWNLSDTSISSSSSMTRATFQYSNIFHTIECSNATLLHNVDCRPQWSKKKQLSLLMDIWHNFMLWGDSENSRTWQFIQHLLSSEFLLFCIANILFPSEVERMLLLNKGYFSIFSIQNEAQTQLFHVKSIADHNDPKKQLSFLARKNYWRVGRC